MLIDADELDVQPPEWLVDGMFPRVGLGFVYGKSYWGKSLMTNGELALAIGNGTDFFSRKTIQGSVIVALGEGAYDANVRKQARLKREEADRLDKAAQIGVSEGMDAAREWLNSQPPYTDGKLKFWSEPFTVPVTRIGNDGEGAITTSLERFINQAKRVKDLELVVLDSLSDFSGGLSISNDTSANRMMLGLKEIVRQLNCCVVVVAHPTADGKKMIGAERLFNAADFVVKVDPVPSSAPDMPQSTTVMCEKNKYGPKFQPTGYTIEPTAWWQPEFDENDDPTGKMVLVTSATVRQRDDEDVRNIGQPVPLSDDVDLYELVTVPSDRPVKRSGLIASGRPKSGRSMEIVRFVNDHPDGVTVEAVADEFMIDKDAARSYLSRAEQRGDIDRMQPGIFSPVKALTE